MSAAYSNLSSLPQLDESAMIRCCLVLGYYSIKSKTLCNILKAHFDQSSAQMEVFVREAEDLAGLSYLRNFIRTNATELGDYGIKLLV